MGISTDSRDASVRKVRLSMENFQARSLPSTGSNEPKAPLQRRSSGLSLAPFIRRSRRSTDRSQSSSPLRARDDCLVRHDTRCIRSISQGPRRAESVSVLSDIIMADLKARKRGGPNDLWKPTKHTTEEQASTSASASSSFTNGSSSASSSFTYGSGPAGSPTAAVSAILQAEQHGQGPCCYTEEMEMLRVSAPTPPQLRLSAPTPPQLRRPPAPSRRLNSHTRDNRG